ncbi:fibronectin type III domain-containing protein [Dyadobacter sp. CY323]|uniref:fibronectin type III domain-containing protein n=1 Tax=Dyadobacter sp. CY323 TaxID=2907302 RepID=UPI001F1CE519|nr:hypothetical protein [Dyadobacter sp. CY323]MCE6992525.1 hypothetical protein [Dyadobacter sp. CY323]
MRTLLVNLTIVLLALGLCMSTNGLAQKPSKIVKISVWQHYRNDTLRLLWVPIHSADWIRYNTSGYHIERSVYTEGQPVHFEKVSKDAVKPQPRNEWKNLGPESYAAAQAIYEKKVPAKMGNNDFTGANESNQQNLRHFVAMLSAFRSPVVARQMGLGLLEIGLHANQKYIYRIYADMQLRERADTAYIMVDTAKPTVVTSPPQLKAQEGERSVNLSWPVQSYSKQFVQYHIERSEDGKTYRQITKTPLTAGARKGGNASYRDSLTANYRPYLYRLSGMTPFGEWHRADFVVKAMGIDKTPPGQPQIESAKHVGGTRVEIKWAMPVPDEDLKGFWVARGSSLSGQFKKINESISGSDTRTITDPNADMEGTNHYIVYAVDSAGNQRASFPAYVTLNDSVAPVPPQKLAGKVAEDIPTKKGIVTLEWQPNPEKDLKGYYVYFANDSTHEFSQITKKLITETTFRDTISLRSLTKNVYYKVAAMDQHFNISSFSAVMTVKRPDIIKPVVPLITGIEVKDSTATIHWQGSPSNDVVEYRLYRRVGNGEWANIKTFRNAEMATRSFTDKVTAVTHEYALEVTDESGLVSDRSPGRAARMITPVRMPGNPDPQVTYSKESKRAKITWQYPAKGTYKIAVYRAEGRGAYRIAGFASGSDSQFFDSPIHPGKYRYILKAIHENGRETGFSKPIEVKML